MQLILEPFYCYVQTITEGIPYGVYEGLVGILSVGMVVLMAWKGVKDGLCYSAALLLVEYVFLLFCLTVGYRATEEGRAYDFHPFWSYKAIAEGHFDLVSENIMNVAVFIPVGSLAGIAMQEANKKMSGWKMAAAIGLCVSVTIELAQFLFRRGFSELDDVFHNTLGSLIGFALFVVLKSIVFKILYYVRTEKNLSVSGSHE